MSAETRKLIGRRNRSRGEVDTDWAVQVPGGIRHGSPASGGPWFVAFSAFRDDREVRFRDQCCESLEPFYCATKFKLQVRCQPESRPTHYQVFVPLHPEPLQNQTAAADLVSLIPAPKIPTCNAGAIPPVLVLSSIRLRFSVLMYKLHNWSADVEVYRFLPLESHRVGFSVSGCK